MPRVKEAREAPGRTVHWNPRRGFCEETDDCVIDQNDGWCSKCGTFVGGANSRVAYPWTVWQPAAAEIGRCAACRRSRLVVFGSPGGDAAPGDYCNGCWDERLVQPVSVLSR